MKYISTRNINNKVSASEAIIKGMASDGGLFVPETFPQIDKEFLTPEKERRGELKLKQMLSR